MVTAVIIAWNEEKNLKRCLTSLKRLTNEIVVVVDESTTDDTAQIAKKAGCKVFTHPHTGIVEPMRNFAISKAKSEWVLVMDADEEVTSGLSDLILNLIQDNKYDYIKIPRKNIIFNKWIKSEHWWPDYVYRLFKKDKLIWNDSIHSHPQVEGRGYEIPPSDEYCIIHHNYQSIDQFVTRLNRYTTFQANEASGSSDSSVWMENLTGEFLSQFFSRRGYRDDNHGLALALLQSFSSLVTDLKAWEKQGFKSESINIDQLRNVFFKMSHDVDWWISKSKIDEAKGIKKYILKLKSKLTI